MEIKEAIEWQKAFKKMYKGIPKEVDYACDIAIFALGKQIPQPVNYEADGYSDGELVYDTAQCPECGYWFECGTSEWESGYCPNCGQHLDWSGADE